VTGVHTGEGIGKPPTGKPVKFTGMTMVRLRDGKIIESWNNFDFMTMYKQIE
jgi:predicted ester cyclase